MTTEALIAQKPLTIADNAIMVTGRRKLDNPLAVGRSLFRLLNDRKQDTKVAITGGALGVDQGFALAALSIGYTVVLAEPFEGFWLRWPPNIQKKYFELRNNCVVVTVSPGGFAPEKYRIRNQWMVDRAKTMLAVWEGDERGGTFDAVCRWPKGQELIVIHPSTGKILT